jgi:hypothetical protein
MLKLLLRVFGEMLIGFAGAGIVLGISIPILIKMGMITKGDLAGSLMIAVTIVAALGWMMFRPNSALNRRDK